MTRYERTAWIMLITSVPAYVIYVVIVLTGAGGGPLHEAPYVWPALITIGATVVANIVLNILTSIVWSRGVDIVDERDRAIEHIGERAGNSFLVIGGVAAMLMAMAEWDWFWIANTLFLCFFISGVIGSLVKVSLHREGVPS